MLLYATSESVSRECFSFMSLFANVFQDENRWLRVAPYSTLTILAEAFTGLYSEPNVIIYFQRLGADCYAVSLLKRHSTLPE